MHTMRSTAPDRAVIYQQEVFTMNEQEKIYKTLNNTGAADIAIGIIVLVTGVASGILMIIGGAKLLRRKRSVMI